MFFESTRLERNVNVLESSADKTWHRNTAKRQMTGCAALPRWRRSTCPSARLLRRNAPGAEGAGLFFLRLVPPLSTFFLPTPNCPNFSPFQSSSSCPPSLLSLLSLPYWSSLLIPLFSLIFSLCFPLIFPIFPMLPSDFSPCFPLSPNLNRALGLDGRALDAPGSTKPVASQRDFQTKKNIYCLQIVNVLFIYL